jgi:hypothetical protein
MVHGRINITTAEKSSGIFSSAEAYETVIYSHVILDYACFVIFL